MPLPLFGDSLTLGRIGIPYHRFLPIESEPRGIEGETLLAILERVERYLRGNAPPRLVIQGGGNDLLLSNRGLILNPNYPPIDSDEEIAPLVDQALDRLTFLSPMTTFIVCSLSILGEELSSPLNQKRRQRNTLLANLLEGRDNFIFCDIVSGSEALIESEQIPQESHYFPLGLEGFTPDAQFIKGDEALALKLSKERKLLVTVDGIHPNGRGARLIASPLAKLLVH